MSTSDTFLFPFPFSLFSPFTILVFPSLPLPFLRPWPSTLASFSSASFLSAHLCRLGLPCRSGYGAGNCDLSNERNLPSAASTLLQAVSTSRGRTMEKTTATANHRTGSLEDKHPGRRRDERQDPNTETLRAVCLEVCGVPCLVCVVCSAHMQRRHSSMRQNAELLCHDAWRTVKQVYPLSSHQPRSRLHCRKLFMHLPPARGLLDNTSNKLNGWSSVLPLRANHHGQIVRCSLLQTSYAMAGVDVPENKQETRFSSEHSFFRRDAHKGVFRSYHHWLPTVCGTHMQNLAKDATFPSPIRRLDYYLLTKSWPTRLLSCAPNPGSLRQRRCCCCWLFARQEPGRRQEGGNCSRNCSFARL